MDYGGRAAGREGRAGLLAGRRLAAAAAPRLRPKLGFMPEMRIALAQVNATVGDLDGNAGRWSRWTQRAAEAGARLVVFPEMLLTGYPVEDLALRASFVEASVAATSAVAARLDAEGLGEIAVRDRLPGPAGRGAGPGRAADRVAPGRGRAAARRAGRGHVGEAPSAELRGVRRVPAISCRATWCRCSGWRPGTAAGRWTWRRRDLRGPVAGRRTGGGRPRGRGGPAGGAQRARRTSGARTTRGSSCASAGPGEAGAALAYVNMIGGQDELVFDGDSIIVAADGDAARAGAAVRRGPGGLRPGAARRGPGGRAAVTRRPTRRTGRR